MADSIPVTEALAEFWHAILGDGDLTYEGIRERGGPTQPTLTKLTKSGNTISAASGRALEDAIGLERGSLRDVAAGGRARWKPEGAPGEGEIRFGYVDHETQNWRIASDLEEGYQYTASWAHTCWKAGAPRELYHTFVDAAAKLYTAAVEARSAREEEPLANAAYTPDDQPPGSTTS